MQPVMSSTKSGVLLQPQEAGQGRPHSNSNLSNLSASTAPSFMPSPRTGGAGNGAQGGPQFRGAGNAGSFGGQGHLPLDPAQHQSASGLNVASQSFRPGQGREGFQNQNQQQQQPNQQQPQQQQQMYQQAPYVADENGNMTVPPQHQIPQGHPGQQPAYYMQQNATAVFVDQQSGQPVYYRVMPPGGMMHSEMYGNAPAAGAVNADGTVVASDEQSQQPPQQMMGFIPYGPGQQGQPQTPQQMQQMQMQQMQQMQMQHMQHMASMGQYWGPEGADGMNGPPVGVYLPSEMTGGSNRGHYVGGNGSNGLVGQHGYSQSLPNLAMGMGNNRNYRSSNDMTQNSDPEGMPLDELGLYGGHNSAMGVVSGHESARSFSHKDNRDNRGRNDYRSSSDDRGSRGNKGGPSREGGGGGGNGRGDRNGGGGAVNPMRDPLVDEFRATYGKGRTWELIDLIGHVVAFCQDQHGSRFIQQRLEVCTEVDKQLIFDEIVPSAHGLMTDVFGNYVLQKLFEYGTTEQCDGLAMLLTGQAAQLSMQMYGCRVVQKALEYVGTQRLISLVAEFENPQVHCAVADMYFVSYC
jgi:hypothetical protein